MSDFRLQAFYAVAKNLSFTKGAQELFITQPAITRHINKLEQQYQVRLFERQHNKVELTKAGELMLQHCERILSEYKHLEYAMHLFHDEHVGQLRLGASTTIAQYVLPPYLAEFIDDFPKAEITLTNGNSRFIEYSLLEHNIDLGLIEGVTRLPTLTYTPFFEDELIVVAGSDNEISRLAAAHNYSINLDEFKKLPLVMRERGSGTFDAIEHNLLQHNIKLAELNICIYLGSTEAIKLFLQNSASICILSRTAVEKELKNGELISLKIGNISFKRSFCFVQAPGPQNPLSERFVEFVFKRKKRPRD